MNSAGGTRIFSFSSVGGRISKVARTLVMTINTTFNVLEKNALLVRDGLGLSNKRVGRTPSEGVESLKRKLAPRRATSLNLWKG